MGGDADTMASIAGAIAEAYYGIPEELQEMGRNSRQYAMLHLTRKSNLQKVVDRINEILKE